VEILSMRTWIVRQNIERFSRLLAEADDPARRSLLLRLIDAERAKLAGGNVQLAAEEPDSLEMHH